MSIAIGLCCVLRKLCKIVWEALRG